MRNRITEIKTRNNESMSAAYQPPNNVPIDFSKIKVGAQTLDDAILKLGFFRKIDERLGDKETVIRAIHSYDLKAMREISDFYYKTSGIYARIIRYMAFMYRFDWFVTPYVNDENIPEKKLLDGFYKTLNRLDDFQVKKALGEISLKVLRFGCYYGYKVKTSTGITLQELPQDYCRSRYNCGNKPAVEFNMKFFDEKFRDANQRMKILGMFPKEFSKGYVLYKKSKLPPEFPGDTNGWYLLDVNSTVKFNANNEDYPMFISVIPLLIDLDAAQDLDRKKTMQRLLKIIIQKMPLDKNGDLVFDVEEAQQLHNNAVQMLGRAIGVDVLTTFADVDVASLSDSSVVSSQSDDLERVERQVFNESGVSQNQFNTDGNIALQYSRLNDESTLYNMILQFEAFLNDLIQEFNKPKLKFRVQILATTIYNFQEMSKLYKEQTQLGYSKMLPQIALGQSQSSILANAYFENDVLDLVNKFIPPLMSSTMNGDFLTNKNAAKVGGKASPEESKAGRKELAADQKSEKTIANQESAS